MQDRGSLWGDTFIKLVFIGIPLVLLLLSLPYSYLHNTEAAQ